MFDIRPAESRYAADHGWLQSRFSFSFADYYDPDNLNFGPMRVLNDDIIQPARGFGAHPHREMEIVTVMLKGQLRHQDSMGHTEILRPGEVQRMTAGTGIVHSEMNPSSEEEAHLLQMWFLPAERGLAPSYEQFAYDREAMRNNLLPVVSNRSDFPHRVAHIHQDMTIYLAEADAGTTIGYRTKEERRTFLFVIEGTIVANGEHRLNRRDSARVTEETEFVIRSETDSHLMLIDLP